MGMRRLVIAVALSVTSLLTGPSASAMLSPDSPSIDSREMWSWNCPPARKVFIVPGMSGSPTARQAAHVFPGRERSQIRHVAPHEAVALVRGVERLGPARLRLYKLDDKWLVGQIMACSPNR